MRGGVQPLSSSAIPMQGNYFDGTPCAEDPPKAATITEIHDLTKTWAAAAKAAVEKAGFDGVEIHGKFPEVSVLKSYQLSLPII